MRKTWQLLTAILVLLLSTGVSFGQNYQTVFEHNYVRGTGEPKLVEKFFNGYAGPAVIQLFNGNAEDDEAERVSSSQISLNNSSIFDASNFNQKVDSLNAQVTLNKGSNIITVLLKSKPNGMIRIVVKQDFNLIDRDGDGFIPKVGEPKGGDCNDDDATINPGASEICDTLDNDCDGEIDEGVTNACGKCGEVPAETCDGSDNDCDGEIDEGDVCVSDNCPDDSNKTEPGICGCGTPDIDADDDGTFTCQNDCDDDNPEIYPGAFDVPDNGVDEDCDGEDAIVSSIKFVENSEDITFYPNPVTDKLYIRIDFEGEMDVQISNLQGRVIHEERVSFSQNIGVLNMKDTHPGIYFIKVINRETQIAYVQKIVRS
jgi:hypothetical protein